MGLRLHRPPIIVRYRPRINFIRSQESLSFFLGHSVSVDHWPSQQQSWSLSLLRSPLGSGRRGKIPRSTSQSVDLGMLASQNETCY